MKWNILVASLVLTVGVCSQSFGFDLLDNMLGLGGCGCRSCCEEQVEPTCCPKPKCCGPRLDLSCLKLNRCPKTKCCPEPKCCPAPKPKCCPAPKPQCCPKPKCCPAPKPKCCPAPKPKCCPAPKPQCCPKPKCCPAPKPQCCPKPEPTCCPERPCGGCGGCGLNLDLFGGLRSLFNCGGCGRGCDSCGCEGEVIIEEVEEGVEPEAADAEAELAPVIDPEAYIPSHRRDMTANVVHGN